ncbi:hypothetical protein BVX98_04800 [bacterium F11]|nr:hypothetical protein BVX98_04800 [bacterium F11]
MSPQLSIQRFNRRANVTLVVFALLRGILRAVPVLLLGFLLISALDHWLEIPYWGRQVLWFLVVVSACGYFLSPFFPFLIFSMKSKAHHLYENKKRKSSSTLRPDELCLALNLSHQKDSPGISSELRVGYLQKVADELDSCSAHWCCPRWSWGRTFTLFLGSLLISGSAWAFFPNHLPLTPRIFFPFGGINLNEYIDISPKNATVPWGGNVEIKVVTKQRSLIKPVLHVKAQNDWYPVEYGKAQKGVQSYVFEGLVEPLHYRVKFKKDWGERYTISPTKPLSVENFQITIRQPDYVGENIIKQTSPEITGLSGSRVTLKANVSLPLKSVRLLFSDGSEEKGNTIKDDGIECRFTLFKKGTYGFRFETKDGSVTEDRERYPLYVIEDQPPTVEMLSPEEDLVVGPSETIPLTFHATDDFGLDKANLIWVGDGKAEKQKKLKTFKRDKENALETFDWDLGAENLKPGSLVRFQIKVLDGNVVTGPGVAETEWRLIEISSFKKGHEAIEEALETWRDKVLELLAEVSTLKSKTEIGETPFDDLTRDFAEATKDSQELEKSLDEIVSAMEEDPLADYEVWLEHRAMSDNFQALNQGAVKKAQAALQTRNKKVASKEMEKISAELERMLALSDELNKVQRARDIRDAGDDLKELGKDLKNQLDAASQNEKGIDPKAMKQIQDLVEKAHKILSEMAQSLQKFPDELPEDFVNQKALKNLEMGKSQDLLSQIQEAMKKGDAKGALELAKQFLDMAEKMRSQITEAHESYLQKDSAEEMANQISKEQEMLESIISKQRDLLSQTQKLESKRLGLVLKKQEKLLQDLAERQQKVVNEVAALLKKPDLEASVKKALTRVQKPVKDTLAEFVNKQIESSPEWLSFVVNHLQQNQNELEKKELKIPEIDSIRKIKEEEKSILEELKKPIEVKDGFSGEEKKMFSGLATKQGELGGETHSLRKNLQLLSQKTANLGVPLIQSLADAQGEMGTAKNQLNGNNSQSAQRAEEAALHHLQSAQNALSQAQQAMGELAGQQMPSGPGGGGRRPRVIFRGKQAGSQGQKVGKVKLPKAEDYRPPKEFREELLESLKEKYPDIYEDIIHKYFKRLSE